jgi:hypothetical protein
MTASPDPMAQSLGVSVARSSTVITLLKVLETYALLVASFSCLGEPLGQAPTAEVIVQRGELNDILILRAHHLKPNLGFDLFTIQNTNLLSNGEVDPKFKNFGRAWYQTDVQANSEGEAEVADQNNFAGSNLRLRSGFKSAPYTYFSRRILV